MPEQTPNNARAKKTAEIVIAIITILVIAATVIFYFISREPQESEITAEELIEQMEQDAGPLRVPVLDKPLDELAPVQ